MNNRRERRFTTYRLLPDDYTLMRDLGKDRPDVKDRYQALLALVPIIEKLEMPSREYKGFRVGIPLALDQAIRDAAKRTGHDFRDILLAAARIYASQTEQPHERNGTGKSPQADDHEVGRAIHITR